MILLAVAIMNNYRVTAMNNEREMLEMAAKAAGYEIRNVRQHETNKRGLMAFVFDPATKQFFWWAPREDDGDALRLACKLRMALDFSTAKNGPDTAFSEELEDVIAVPITKWMDTESMRLAIVRAAAEIGRGMP